MKVSKKNEEKITFYFPYLLNSLQCVFCHVVCNFLNFQLQAKISNFIRIEFAWTEWPIRIERCGQIRKVPAQTALGTQVGLGTQTCHKTPGDLWVKTSKDTVIKMGE